MNFFAVDFETANANRDSICQFGLAEVSNGKVISTTSRLVNPETYFDPINTSIHGIEEKDVRNSATFPEVFAEFAPTIAGNILICHTAFDRVSMERTCSKYKLQHLNVVWLDSARVVRRAWPEFFGSKGYGLGNVAATLGIEFNHHDAGEDARAAAEAIIQAVNHTGITLDDWVKTIIKPIYKPSNKAEVIEPNSDGPFFGAEITFTGALEIPRREAAVIAGHLGFIVGKSVTRKTDILVVGDQDATKLAGKSKSNKHIKAEDMIQNGSDLVILTESDFSALIDSREIQ